MIVKKIYPFVKKVLKRIFYIRSRPSYGWFGDYSTWAEAKKVCTGYDNDTILDSVKASVMKVKNGEAVYERDSVLFDEIQYSQPILDSLKNSAKNGVLNIIDFGGSLGSSYFQNRTFLKELAELKWNIVEQAHFVECGRTYIQDDQLKFYYSIEDALLENKSNVLFLSSVIQYFENPYQLISDCLKYEFETIIIDRTAFVESFKERITVQIVPEFIYKASYPAWFFNEQKFVDAFSKQYNLISKFDSKFDPREQLEDKTWSYRKGFVFKRK